MRKKLFFMLFAIGAFALLTSETHYSSASPGAKTGSPGDGANCTQCHSGTTLESEEWISTDIPEAGYVEGEIYTITLTATHAGVSKFGFEATIEDANNAKVGEITITNSTETKLTNSDHAITHKSAGITPSGDEKIWSFDWTAPASGTGTVNVYTAFNAANGNGGTSGDVVYLSSLEIIENTVGVESFTTEDAISLYPIPFENTLNINTNIDVKEIKIYNLAGSLVVSQIENNSENSRSINTNMLDAGLYFISIINEEGKVYTQKAVKSN